jgi:hypothetical protein
MADLALRSDTSMDIGSADIVTGEVVRKLVAWSEREIDRLVAELDVALLEAEAAERQVAQQPAAAGFNTAAGAQPAPAAFNTGGGQQPATTGLDPGAGAHPWPSDITQILPVTPAAAAPAPEEAQPRPTVRRSATGTAARTTVVVRRESPVVQATEPVLADADGWDGAQPSPAGRETGRRPGRKPSLVGRLRDHWMMAVGLAVTLVGLALLLFG